MKLRIRGNSIRLRLTRSEVEQLASEGEVEEVVHFGQPDLPFTYRITTSNSEKVAARFEGRRISVSIPLAEADAWSGSEDVAVEGFQTIDENQRLRILVEKDYACLTEREGEDESDAFPNPSRAAKC